MAYGLLAFCAAAAIEGLWVLWAKGIEANKRWLVAGSAGVMAAGSVFTIGAANGERWVFIAVVLGHTVGGYLGMLFKVTKDK